MIDAKYDLINDETLMVEKINSLEKMAREELVGDTSLTFVDLHMWSAIDKSLKLIDSFLFAFEQQNITVLAALTRMQMDCVLRTYAGTLVADGEEFCKKVLCDNIRINKVKDLQNKPLTDKYLCESLGTVLHLPLYELYQKISGYVHLSSSSFHNITKPDGENGFTMVISKKNRDEDLESYKRLSLELANHFYYFGKILITVCLRSWIEQKKAENLD